LPAMEGREREIKLTARTLEALEELARQPAIAGFALSSVETRNQEDVYLDSEDFHLFAAGHALRYRRRSGILKATLKEIQGTAGRETIRDRREIEEVLGAEGRPTGVVGDIVASLAGEAELLPILHLRTRRRVRKVFAGGSAVAELCLDEVEVSRGEGAEPLARFREVEVEETSEGSNALAAIGEDLLSSPQFEPSPLSKLERGLDLLGLLEPAREAARRNS
jgi:inorganic triphosphatase YgiF